MKKIIGFALALSLAFSATSRAHGTHYGSALGVAFNSVEVVKHGAVIYDQLSGPADQRSHLVLLGNMGVLLAHMFQANTQLEDIQGGNPESGRFAKILLVLANLGTIADFAVDGVNFVGYLDKDWSVAKIAADVVTPACVAFNLYSSLKRVRST
jgi:hypothetical protein